MLCFGTLMRSSLALILLSPGTVCAATVDIALVPDHSEPTGPFQIVAKASVGDSGGIAGVKIDLAGVASTVNLAPFTPIELERRGPAGFFEHSADDVLPIIANQDTTRPNSLVYGIGQRPLRLETGNPLNFVRIDVPVLIAEVRPDKTFDDIEFVSAEAVVFQSEGSTNVIPAEVTFTIIPEPTVASALVGAGAAALLRRRAVARSA